MVLAVLCLLFSGIYSYLAPGGSWKNQVFGTELWYEHDPGGHYLASAHQLLEVDRRPLFPGHPGTTLQLLLQGVQRGLFWLGGDEDLTFRQFVARNLRRTYFFSKLLMTLLHLVSFYVLYRLAETLTGGRAAVLAVLAYATSLPVMYFLSRISVEPLMVIFFAAMFVCIWDCHARLRRQETTAALILSGLAGALAVSGAVTKLNFLGPLPFFGLVYIVMGGHSEVAKSGIEDKKTKRKADAHDRPGFADSMAPGRTQVLAGFVYAAAATGALFAYSEFIHWGDLVEHWSRLATQVLPERSWFDVLVRAPVVKLCELPFIVVGLVGWAVFLARGLPERAKVLWLSAYCAYSLGIWALVPSFHYFFLPATVLAVFFGYASDLALRRLTAGTAPLGQWSWVLAWILLFHLVAVWSVIDSRRADVRAYRGHEVFEMVSKLGAHERIGVLDPSGWQRAKAFMRPLHGLRSNYAPKGMTPLLEREFARLFVPVKRGAVDAAAIVDVPPLGRCTVVRVAPSALVAPVAEPGS